MNEARTMPGSHDNSLRKRAERFVLNGEYVRALEVYRAMLASDGPNPKAWYGIGYTYYKLGRLDQSEAALRAAREGGYWPARTMLDRIARHRMPQSTPPQDHHDDGQPRFLADTPAAPPQGSDLAALRQEQRHRKEELIAFLDRLATHAMQCPGFLTDADCGEVNQAHATHEVASEHLKTCRRALRSLENRARERTGQERGDTTVHRDSRALEEARRAHAGAEADEEAHRKNLRRARRRLAIKIIEQRNPPEALAPCIHEIETLRRELELIETRLSTAASAAALGRDPRRESGVGAAG
jgi:tetratricopeptide (TPR) repeat protein